MTTGPTLNERLTRLKLQCGEDHTYEVHPNGRWVLLQRRCRARSLARAISVTFIQTCLCVAGAPHFVHLGCLWAWVKDRPRHHSSAMI